MTTPNPQYPELKKSTPDDIADDLLTVVEHYNNKEGEPVEPVHVEDVPSETGHVWVNEIPDDVAAKMQHELILDAAKQIQVNKKTNADDVNKLVIAATDPLLDAGARAQALMKAALAARQLTKNNRRKKIKFWLGWFVFFALLGGLCYGGWVWGKDKLETGRYTVPVTCKIPFGDGEFEARRHFTYPFKSLLGYHLVDESSVSVQDEIVLKGEKLTILGIKDGRTWRQNFAKGEFGVAKLKSSDIYWFVGDNIKDTAAVRFNTLCNK